MAATIAPEDTLVAAEEHAEKGAHMKNSATFGTITAGGCVHVLINSPGAIVASDQETIALDVELEALLIGQVEGCQTRDVKFRSVHMVSALLRTQKGFAEFCFDHARSGFADEVRQLVDRFISRQQGHAQEKGHIAVDFSADPFLMDAGGIASQEKAKVVDERHLLLSFLASTSGFRQKISKELGSEVFLRLMQTVESRRPTQSAGGMTSDIF